MTLLDEAAHGLGAALLPVVTGLLLEELTFGGLVRLLIAPWPKTKRTPERNHPEGNKAGNGERKCSH
jgi:hypothetical protein